MRGATELSRPASTRSILEEYAVAGLLEYLSYIGFAAWRSRRGARSWSSASA